MAHVTRAMQPSHDVTLAGSRVVIWGMGRHGGGIAAAEWCHKHGAEVHILDQRVPQQLQGPYAHAAAAGWAWHVGNATHPILNRADLIIASPAIPPHVLAQLPADGPAIMAPEALFLAAHRGPRVAVTGTKGKSTTAAVLARLLGWHIAGNSNEPLLSALRRLGPDAPIVCELSSFQLWYMQHEQHRFDIVVLTNIMEDHLDWHSDKADYHNAKHTLLRWANAAVVDTEYQSLLNDGCRTIAPASWDSAHFYDSRQQALAPVSACNLVGEHNRHNVALALAAAADLGVQTGLLSERLATFLPLPHRLNCVHTNGNIRFIDDSIATTPDASIAALDAITGPVSIILGGSDKGADFGKLADAIAARAAQPVLLGSTARCIADALATHNIQAPIVENLPQAIQQAVSFMHDGGSVLLSPACASFGMFADFEQRGETFSAYAKAHFPEQA